MWRPLRSGMRACLLFASSGSEPKGDPMRPLVTPAAAIRPPFVSHSNNQPREDAMDSSIGLNRSARVFATTVALAAGLVSNNAISGPDVTVANVPLPVTGSVNATVSGTVGISGTPNVSVTSMPPVSVTSMPPVSVALPAQPFFDEITLLSGGDTKAVGVVGKRLAVTTLTITNFDSNPQQLFLFNPVMSGPSCSGGVIGGATPIARALLEPRKTVQLQFPTPMVFSLGGLGCIAAEVTTVMTGGSVVIDVVGFAAP
jgi:hypothetical protein